MHLRLAPCWLGRLLALTLAGGRACVIWCVPRMRWLAPSPLSRSHRAAPRAQLCLTLQTTGPGVWQTGALNQRPTSSGQAYWWDDRPPPPPPTFSCYRGWDSSHYDQVMSTWMQKPLHADLHPTVRHFGRCPRGRGCFIGSDADSRLVRSHSIFSASFAQLCEVNCSNISPAYNETQWCVTMELSEIGSDSSPVE